MREMENNTDPYKGYVDIDLEGDERQDSSRKKFKTHGVKALNIKNYGCIVVTWNGGQSYRESALSLPNVYAKEEDGKFVLVGE